MINILIVDDHPSVGEGTKAMLEQEEDIMVDVISDCMETEKMLGQREYQVILLDLYMPNMNGIDLASKIKQINSDIVVIIYTGFDLNTHFNLFTEAEIDGFVSKTATKDQLVTVIRCGLRGEVVIPLQLFKQLKRAKASSDEESNKEMKSISLTEKETSILHEVSKGLTNRQIAEQLHMSQRSVEYSLTGIFNKLEVRSRTEALMKAKNLGLISERS